MSSVEFALYQAFIFPRIKKYVNLVTLYFGGYPLMSIIIIIINNSNRKYHDGLL